MKTIISTAILIVIASCSTSSTENKKENKLKMEVIAIHDEAMDEMSSIMGLRRELKASIDSTQLEEYESAISALNESHENMMIWMRKFSKEFPNTTLQGGAHTYTYTLINSRLGLIYGDFSLFFWAQNLNDEIYLAFGNPDTGFGRNVRTAAPRTYGVTLTGKF